jgi:hypothetical protein
MNYRKHIPNVLMTILVGATLTPAIAGVGVQTNPPFKQGSQPARKEISRERAIKIARERSDFKPKSVKAVRMIEDNHKIWRVTIHGEPFGKLRPIGGTMMVSVDRLTGKILSFSKNYCLFGPESIFESKQ